MGMTRKVDARETQVYLARLFAAALTDAETPGVITADELQNIADEAATWIRQLDSWEQAAAAMRLTWEKLNDAAAHWGDDAITFSGKSHDRTVTPLAYDPIGDAGFGRAVELWLAENRSLFIGLAPTRAKDLRRIEESLPKAGWGDRQFPLQTNGGAVTFDQKGRAGHDPWYHFHYKPETFGATPDGLVWVSAAGRFIALRPVGERTLVGMYTDPYDPEAEPGKRFEYRIVVRLNEEETPGVIDYLRREVDVETRKPRMDEGVLVRSWLSESDTDRFRAFAAGE